VIVLALTTNGLQEFAQTILGILDYIEYEQDGVTKTKSITNTSVSNGVINIYITFDETENGVFSNFKVYSTSGNIVSQRANSFTKTEGSLAVLLQYTVKEV